jgi:hypothetical protein
MDESPQLEIVELGAAKEQIKGIAGLSRHEDSPQVLFRQAD